MDISLGAAAFCLSLACTAASAAELPSTPVDRWVVNGTVNAIVRTADATYLGGEFTVIGPNRPYGVPLDATSGQPVGTYPKPNGTVHCCVPDGAGGWYIGGSFTRVGAVDRNRLAHIKPDGTVDAAWDPNVEGITVYALAVSGATVYAGGDFTTIGGTARNRLAAIGTDGTLSAWNPNADGVVGALAVSGTTVYVGGEFMKIGATARYFLAAIGTDGTLSAWNPSASSAVYALAVSGTTVYAGGIFTKIGATDRRFLAAIGTDGTLSAWNPNAGYTVYALAVSGTTVYAGGAFTTIGGTARNRLAAIGTDGTLAAWNPNVAGTLVYALAVSGATVYAGGDFTTIGGTTRNRLAAIGTDGTLAAWDPNAGGTVNALAVSGATVYAGGGFVTIGGTTRNRLAAIGMDGTLAAWDPNAGGTVNALAVSGTTVYAGGAFTTVNGATARNRLAAFDTSTGTATAWNPNASGVVRALAVSGATVYAGGEFLTIGATARNRLAAIGTDGTLAAWDPNASSTVYALAVSGTTVYAGGSFTTIGITKTRSRLAAIGTDGTLAAWNPYAGSTVRALAVSGTMVYAGGSFTTIGGTTRNRLAAIGMDGTLAAWNPNASGVVYALAVSDTTVYAGGNFTNIGITNTRIRLAAIGTDGTLAAWDPNAGDTVYALAVSGATVYAGGDFTKIGGNPVARFAQFGANPTTTTLASSLNPSGYGASVTFTATVSPSVATGTVTFKNDANTLGTGTLSGGTATFTTSNLSLGDHSITAEYAGDNTYMSGASSPLSQTVNPALATLTIRSPYGMGTPAVGLTTNAIGSVLTNVMANPEPAGGTQYICTGWSMIGNEPASGTTASCVMTLTNDAVLTWLWTTNYYLNTAAVPGGSVTVGSGWQPLGVTTQITAVAASYYHFTSWSGDASGASNPLELLMDAPKSVTANFAANYTTTHPTPEAWLAQYGITPDFDQNSLEDTDHDGLVNWQEYVAGTDPTNAASRLVMTALGPVFGTNYTETVRFYPATNIVIRGVLRSWEDHWRTQRVYEVVGHSVTWLGVTGRVYNVEYSTNLLNWTSLEGATNLLGRSPDNTVTDMPPARVKFYRVNVHLP